MKSDKKKEADRKKDEKPRIVEAEKADRGDRPNTCRACGGSKFC
jgi:hypothetical protein